MSNSVYSINKGINKSIEFKGLKAQYIWYLGGALLALLILFAILYIIGVSPILCVVIVLASGTAVFVQVYRMSARYGEYGLMKEMAARRVPKVVHCRGRKIFRKPVSEKGNSYEHRSN
ncbi:MAG: DUF4133 domain-containing protein [Bacteroidetes bacterium]|nr:DUF4133 domain-containing protein [Bacteroidota bacterium]